MYLDRYHRRALARSWIESYHRLLLRHPHTTLSKRDVVRLEADRLRVSYGAPGRCVDADQAPASFAVSRGDPHIITTKGDLHRLGRHRDRGYDAPSRRVFCPIAKRAELGEQHIVRWL